MMNIQRFLEALRQGAVDPVHAARYHGGGKSAPPQPDYRGAALEQAQAGKENLTQQTWANRPTVNTPWGQQSWESGSTTDPATGQPVTQWTQNITLSPEQQAAQSAQADITQGRSEAAKTLLGQSTEAFQKPFDWAGQPAVPGSVSDAQKGAYQTMSAALEPGRSRAVSSLDTKLANMGLPMGSEAYKNAQRDQGDIFAQQDKQVLAQAMGEGRSDVATQQQMRQAGIAEEAQRRGMTLNELNALLTGQQVSMPQMPGFSQAGVAQAPNLLGAAQSAGDYGLKAAEQGTDWGQLAGAAMQGAGMAKMF